MSVFPEDPLSVLTVEERHQWFERDEMECMNWIRRMIKVDSVMLLSKKKVPRHRYNANPDIP